MTYSGEGELLAGRCFRAAVASSKSVFSNATSYSFYRVTHWDPSLLRVTVDIVDGVEGLERRGSSREDPPPSSFINAKFREFNRFSHTEGDSGDCGWGVSKVLHTNHTKYDFPAINGMCGLVPLTLPKIDVAVCASTAVWPSVQVYLPQCPIVVTEHPGPASTPCVGSSPLVLAFLVAVVAEGGGGASCLGVVAAPPPAPTPPYSFSSGDGVISWCSACSSASSHSFHLAIGPLHAVLFTSSSCRSACLGRAEFWPYNRGGIAYLNHPIWSALVLPGISMCDGAV